MPSSNESHEIKAEDILWVIAQVLPVVALWMLFVYCVSALVVLVVLAVRWMLM